MRSYRPPSELEPGGTNCLEQAREDAYGRPVGGGLGGGGGGWGGSPAGNFFCTELRAAPCSRGTWLAIWCVCRVRSADGRVNIESRILIKRLPDLRAHGAGFNMSSIPRATARKCFKPLDLGELSPRNWMRSTVQVPRNPG